MLDAQCNVSLEIKQILWRPQCIKCTVQLEQPIITGRTDCLRIVAAFDIRNCREVSPDLRRGTHKRCGEGWQAGYPVPVLPLLHICRMRQLRGHDHNSWLPAYIYPEIYRANQQNRTGRNAVDYRPGVKGCLFHLSPASLAAIFFIRFPPAGLLYRLYGL